MAAKSSENENRRRSVRGQGKVHQSGRGEVSSSPVETSPHRSSLKESAAFF